MGVQIDRWPTQSRMHFGHPRMHSHQSGALVVDRLKVAECCYYVYQTFLVPNACAHISFPLQLRQHLEVPPDINGSCHETRQAHQVLPSNQREIDHQAMSSLIGQAPSHLTRKMSIYILMPCKETDPKTSCTGQ